MTLNKNILLERENKKASKSSKHITGESPQTLRTYVNMILHISVTKRASGISDHNDTIVPTIIIKGISETTHDPLVTSKDTNHEFTFNSETTHVIVLAAHEQHIIFALKIYAHIEGMIIHVLVHS